MAYKALQTVLSVSEESLTTPTSAQVYPLGSIYQFRDSAAPNAVKTFMYVKATGALTLGVPYAIIGGATSGAEITTAAPPAASGNIRVGIPQVAFTSGYYGWLQIVGVATFATGAVATTVGNTLKVLPAGVTLVDTTGTTLADNVVGYAYSTTTTAVTTGTVMMLDKFVATS